MLNLSSLVYWIHKCACMSINCDKKLPDFPIVQPLFYSVLLMHARLLDSELLFCTLELTLKVHIMCIYLILHFTTCYPWWRHYQSPDWGNQSCCFAWHHVWNSTKYQLFMVSIYDLFVSWKKQNHKFTNSRIWSAAQCRLKPLKWKSKD